MIANNYLEGLYQILQVFYELFYQFKFDLKKYQR